MQVTAQNNLEPAQPDWFPTDLLGIEATLIQSDRVRFRDAGFVIALPEGWNVLQQSPDSINRQMNDVAGFSLAATLVNGDRQYGFADIRKSRVAFDVGPGDWLKVALCTRECEVLESRECYTQSGWDLDLLLRYREADRWVISRNAVCKNRDNVYWIEAGAQMQQYELQSKMLWGLIQSFELVEVPVSEYAETIESSEFGKADTIRIKHPASWKVIRSRLTEDTTRLHLDLDVEEQSMGRIFLHKMVGPIGTGAATLTSQLEDDLAALELDVPALEFDFHPYEGKQLTTLCANTIAIHPLKGEFAVGAMITPHGEGSCLVGNLAPTFDRSPEWWSINKRAFEIVRDSVIDQSIAESTASTTSFT